MDQKHKGSSGVAPGEKTKVCLGSLREHMEAVVGGAGSLPATAQAISGETHGGRNQALFEKFQWFLEV